ncbi:hypothetical protein [Cyclobacterium xiamenense]|uniref:hypothetical protein n=1 Tax=Cyclobacterium xiamenense TaxID=1297121 RepID=UPI0035D108F0
MKFSLDQGINQYGLFNGVNDPLFLDTRFLLNFVIVCQFLSIGSRRTYVYEYIRGANTSGIVQLTWIATNITIELDYRIHCFISFGLFGQNHIKWSSMGFIGLVFEVIEKSIEKISGKSLMQPVGSG